MSEARKNPDRKAETQAAIVKDAVAFHDKGQELTAAVSRAMKGKIADNDPQRNQYFGQIMARCRRAIDRRVAQTPIPVPKNSIDLAERRKRAEQTIELIKQARRDITIQEAREQEQTHPDDAYKNNE